MTELRLYIGKSFTDITVREDANWPRYVASALLRWARRHRDRALGHSGNRPRGPAHRAKRLPPYRTAPGAQTDPPPHIRRGAA